MKNSNPKKKKWLHIMRNGHNKLAGDSPVDTIQHSLEAINAQLGNLTSLAKSMECLETFTKERLEAKSRDNLRLESLKKLFRLACGNLKFASEILANDNTSETFASLQRRMLFMKNTVEKLLNDEGVRPIVPSQNDPVSESEHRIVQTVAPDHPECMSGHIAECLEIGFAVHGVVTPAEVTVFASGTGPDENREMNNN